MHPLLLNLLLLLLSLGLLWAGAESLVKGASALALRLGLTPLVVGLTVVAYGTSTPELIVSAKATLLGQGDIAMGNVVGSNILNVALILGLAALIQPLRAQMQLIRLDVPLMIGASFLLVLFFLDRIIQRWEAAVFLALLTGYTLFNIRLARQESAAIREEYAAATPAPQGPFYFDLAFIVGGLAVLVLGSRLLVDSSIFLARTFGLSEAIIGLTIVAAGTSMPELATSVVAALRRQADISIGNIVGSNIYNILGILGVAGLLAPVTGAGISAVDLAIMVGLSVLLLPLLRTGFTIQRWEGGLLLAVYAGYLLWLWP